MSSNISFQVRFQFYRGFFICFFTYVKDFIICMNIIDVDMYSCLSSILHIIPLMSTYSVNT